MAMFLTPLIAELTRGDDSWTLSSPLIYSSDLAIDGRYVIKVPAGFTTDFASVPRFPLVYAVAGNTAHKAAVVHDYLYQNGIGTKYVADRIFLEAMKVSGIPLWRRQLMYLAVRVGGKGNFKPQEA